MSMFRQSRRMTHSDSLSRSSNPIVCFRDIRVFTHKTDVAALEKLMSDFALHHRAAASAAPAGFIPKTGDLVSAKFSEDNQWYRARVKRASGIKKEASLQFIDYGNEETLPFSRIRPLDPKFKSLEGQAKDARLR